MTMFATIAACYRAAEELLVFNLLAILGLLIPLKLKEARGPPITVMGVAWSSFVVSRMTVKKDSEPLCHWRGGLLH